MECNIVSEVPQKNVATIKPAISETALARAPGLDRCLRLLSTIERDIAKKVKDKQSGIPTFFDNLTMGIVEMVRSNERKLRQDDGEEGEPSGLRQEVMAMDTAINAAALLKAQPRFVPHARRSAETTNHVALPWELTDAQYAATQGIDECLQWRGMPLFKSAFDFALYPMMIWDVKPKTVIELGSGVGTSALWYADLLESFVISGHIFSIDIRKVETQRPGVTFIQGDCRKIAQVLPLSLLETLPHPWLVIEDAHVNTAGILLHLRRLMRKSDYLVVEDSDNKTAVLAQFMREFATEFMVDRRYTDFFGRNATCSPDSIFVRV